MNLRSGAAALNPAITGGSAIVPATSARAAASGHAVLTFEKNGYKLATKTITDNQNDVAVQILQPEQDDSFSADTEIVVNEGTFEFPLSLPGERITIKKVIKIRKQSMTLSSTGVKSRNELFTLVSNSPRVKTWGDLFRLEQAEYEAERQKYGVMGKSGTGTAEGLAKRQFKHLEKIRVVIALKIYPHPKALNRMKHPVEVLKARALEELKRVPVVDKRTFMRRYGIKEVVLQKECEQKRLKHGKWGKHDGREDLPPDIIVADVNAATLRALSFDPDVASVEEYSKWRPVWVNDCLCGGMPWFYPCLSSYANSAYNPASAMPADAKGQGVRAATWEIGLREQFITCFNQNDPRVITCNRVLGNTTAENATHSEECFKNLADAAPYAELYHHGCRIDAFPSPPIYYHDSEIVAWGIQTISQSLVSGNCTDTGSNDNDAWTLGMKRTDLLAYRWPYAVLFFGTGNDGFCHKPYWRCYNVITVGNVQHADENHFILSDSANHCSWRNASQAANPRPRYLHWGAELTNVFDCSCYDPSRHRGDREMPVIVAPGISPMGAGSFTADPCITFVRDSVIACAGPGTSSSCAIANGIAACVISADPRMRTVMAPEVVRLVLLATAHNVDDKEWTDYFYWVNRWDGRDGAGVISGTDAVWFARNHQTVAENDAAVVHGISTNYLTSADSGSQKYFNIQVPDPMPSGKHLRVAVTWSSSPCENENINELSDRDLFMPANTTWYSCFSWDDNVEMIDVPHSDLTAGSPYYVVLDIGAMRIPACAHPADTIYYAIGWTWPKDHAE